MPITKGHSENGHTLLVYLIMCNIILHNGFLLLLRNIFETCNFRGMLQCLYFEISRKGPIKDILSYLSFKSSNKYYFYNHETRSLLVFYVSFVLFCQNCCPFSMLINDITPQLDVAMGGRLAEELTFGVEKVTTGGCC